MPGTRQTVLRRCCFLVGGWAGVAVLTNTAASTGTGTKGLREALVPGLGVTSILSEHYSQEFQIVIYFIECSSRCMLQVGNYG